MAQGGSPGESLPASRGQAGDDPRSEFERIFFEHYERVLGVLLRLTGNRAQAEELANDVFWRLSLRPLSWMLHNNVGGWLYRAATNAAIDAFRAAGKRTRWEREAARSDITAAPPEAELLRDIVREEDRARVRRVLASMRPARAQLLLMRAGGCSYKELSEALGVRVGSVGKLLNRSEEEFRNRYLGILTKEEQR